MAKVIDDYTERLFLAELKTHHLELLLEATRDREALKRINEFRFFLKELADPEDVMNACIKVASGLFRIHSTIGVPDIKEHLAHVAFQKVMTKQDLSKFTFSSDDLEINMCVPEENIRDFILALAEFKRKKPEGGQEGGGSGAERRAVKNQDKDRALTGCDKFFFIQQQLSRYYSVSANSKARKDKKKKEENEEQDCII